MHIHKDFLFLFCCITIMQSIVTIIICYLLNDILTTSNVSIVSRKILLNKTNIVVFINLYYISQSPAPQPLSDTAQLNKHKPLCCHIFTQQLTGETLYIVFPAGHL